MTELALKDIQAAVATTIIDEAQGARIITLAQNRRRFCHSITEKDEPFEMFRGFSEIHITVGLVILCFSSSKVSSELDLEGALSTPVTLVTILFIFSATTSGL